MLICIYAVDGNATTNELAAQYTYHSWGNILSATGTLEEINPFRYRGYYYDEETNFYYLQSRYYNPEIGRFLNTDVYIFTGQGVVGYMMKLQKSLGSTMQTSAEDLIAQLSRLFQSGTIICSLVDVLVFPVLPMLILTEKLKEEALDII